MSVRRMSALRSRVFTTFRRDPLALSLKNKGFSPGLSSPKAKVTRSNRVGCARYSKNLGVPVSPETSDRVSAR